MDQEFVAGGNATLSGNPIRSGAEYIESLRGRNLRIYLMGDPVVEPVDHPIIRPSINAVAETYDLANSNPELASAISPLTGERINRFLHVATSPPISSCRTRCSAASGSLRAPASSAASAWTR
jgi:4-hydroxybutyryl-CoA dehydratase/vinylacetyl-CoA-Delta-isomerase